MDDLRTLVRDEMARAGSPSYSFDDLGRRRDRKRRNQRIGAGALAIILALVSFVALTRAFRTAERPADEPTPRPQGIFSEVGGWIAYGNDEGIWAVNPTRRAIADRPDPAERTSRRTSCVVERRLEAALQSGGVRRDSEPPHDRTSSS